MVRSNTSFLVYQFNKPDDLPLLKLNQEVVCPALENHGYIFQKKVTALEKIVNKFNH